MSPFQWHYSPDNYAYVENGLKNNPGANLKVQNKVVPVYENIDSGPTREIWCIAINISHVSYNT